MKFLPFICFIFITLFNSTFFSPVHAAENKLFVLSSKNSQPIEGAIIYDRTKLKAYQSNHQGIVFLDDDSNDLQVKAKYHQPKLFLSGSKSSQSITLQYDEKLLADDQALIHKKENVQWGAPDEYRANNDLLTYDLSITVNPAKKFITGNNKIRFKMLKNDDVIRIDLYQNLTIDKILYQGKPLKFKRELNAVYISFPRTLINSSTHEIDFHYSGQPIAKGRFGCFTFNKDNQGFDWINTACQGVGSMVWWPNKDQQSDEVESMIMRVSVPSALKDISNGRLIETNVKGNGYTEYVWQTLNPINNYSVSLNIGNYVHFGEKLDNLTLDYYVLAQDLVKAKKQFKQAKPMMVTYQKYFGEYPFIKDGFKLIQAPYTGMEHQSAITYGNGFKNGYNSGRADPDWTGVGISLKFDFIIIHESGHEWFGNSLTSYDFSDAWIHEGWCTYAEAVYVEDQFGYDNAIMYLNGYKSKVSNKFPMIGPPSVSHWPTSDIYFKGTLFINTLRHVINDDEKWWAGVKAFTSTFKKSQLNTADVLNFFNHYFDDDFEKIFDQYLYFNEIPTLVISNGKNQIKYRWKSNVEGFNMPLDVKINGNITRLYPTDDWQTIESKTALSVLENLFYINIEVNDK
jgi:aminopeptidase N